ncbi:MAG TPA: protein phosphatase 2C domain-containing protein [Gammaproteobacteria bacterium]|nr:protein phosphatase 2C domain-containing protein [Gammaproteobacteria bacterium]
MTAASSFRWTSCGRSEVGNVRKLNEDAFVDVSARGLWAVADGMGGHAAGDIASRMVTDRLRDVGSHDTFSGFVDEVEDRVLEANGRLYAMAMEGDAERIIGCTLVGLLANGRYVLSVWAGDSRVYRMRAGKLEQLTRDHSEVEEMLERGEVTEGSPEALAAQNIVTRAVGGSPQLFLDYALDELRSGDRYLLCSDGLYKELSAADITERLADGKASCVEVCDALLETALSRACADNVTAIVVDFFEAKD